MSIRPIMGKSALVCREVEEFLGASDEHYPGIDAWWRKRVFPELDGNIRVCEGVRAEGRLIGLCIGKFGTGAAKLCTLRIEDPYRGRGLASILLGRFTARAIEVRARRAHFTMGDGCEFEFGDYFRSLGFSRIAWERDRYRRGRDEQVFGAAPADVRRRLERRYC